MPTPPPCTLIIFGATGDLAKKKLAPALYRLHVRGALHPATRIFAIGRREYTDARIRAELKEHVEDARSWAAFSRRISYHRLEFEDDEAYAALGARLAKESAAARDRRIFYLATPQEAFPVIVGKLSASRLARRGPAKGWHRIVFEKPFGSDLASASALNACIARLYDEKQVYHIDHYLGKGFVQEIFAIRFANPVLEHIWSREHIDNVQITIAETEGVGERAGYYDRSGATRDMVQNHILQLLALTAMEPPPGTGAETMREEKTRVLRAIDGAKARLVTGQYAAGKGMPAYRKEAGVGKGSETETFVVAKLLVDNDRWEGVPFYVRTGKALMHKYAQIAITFKQGSCTLFQNRCPETNVLVIRIQPDEGIKLRINLAEGQTDGVSPCEMSFLHEAHGFNTPEAYEVLLQECMLGDQMLFTDWGFVRESWRIVDAMRAKAGKPVSYAPGSHGPKEALALIKKDGRDWVGNSEIIK